MHEFRIASPCPADWEQMTGDDRVRHCAQCDLDVHNFSAMTEAEVDALVARASASQSRLCARFYRRADGTILTQDCPVGFRQRVQQVTRRAAGVLAAAMLPGLAWAQQKAQVPKADSTLKPRLVQIENTGLLELSVEDGGEPLGVIDPADPAQSGKIIPQVKVEVFDQNNVLVWSDAHRSDALWRVQLPPGTYRIAITARRYFGQGIPEVKVVSGKSVVSRVALLAAPTASETRWEQGFVASPGRTRQLQSPPDRWIHDCLPPFLDPNK